MPLQTLAQQVSWLFLLAIPIACIAWTVTHEEMFKEPREFCKGKCASAKNIFVQKFFYLFTCEYCFSHYVTILMLFITGYHLLFADWRGYIIAGFSLVWIANCYMSIYSFLRVNLKLDQLEAKKDEKELDETKSKPEP